MRRIRFEKWSGDGFDTVYLPFDGIEPTLDNVFEAVGNALEEEQHAVCIYLEEFEEGERLWKSMRPLISWA